MEKNKKRIYLIQTILNFVYKQTKEILTIEITVKQQVFGQNDPLSAQYTFLGK